MPGVVLNLVIRGPLRATFPNASWISLRYAVDHARSDGAVQEIRLR